MNELLTSISPSHAPQTRSQAAEASRKRKRGSSPLPAASQSVPSLQETPIAELFVNGMSDEQVWAELELRAKNVCDVLDYALDGPVQEAESGEDEGSEEDDEEEERELKRMRQALIDEGFDPDELEGMGFDEDGEDDSEDDDEDDEDDEESNEEEDGLDDGDLGEDVEGLRDPSDEEEELEADEPSFLSGGKRTLRLKPKRGGHPVLDDGFFDLAAFNAEIEAAESKNVSRGRLSKDDDDDDDNDGEDDSVDYFAPVDDTAAFDEEDLEGGGGMCTSRYICSRPSSQFYRAVLQGLFRATKSKDAKGEEAY